MKEEILEELPHMKLSTILQRKIDHFFLEKRWERKMDAQYHLIE